MTEEKREIKTPAGTFRLTGEAPVEDGPTPQMQERAQALATQSQHERGEAERQKISIGDHGRQRAERELEEYRQRQLLLWKQRGGTEEEFGQNWPSIKAEHIREESRRASENFNSAY